MSRLQSGKCRKLALLIIVIYITIYYSWLIFLKGNEDMIVFGGDLFQLIAPFIASYWLYKTFLSAADQERKFWLLLSLGCLFYFFGQAVWSYYELVLRVSPPFPGLADAFWILQYLLFLVALLYWMYYIKYTLSMIRFLFDILLIMIAAITVSWDTIISPLLSLTRLSNSLLFNITYVGYPIGDLGLLFGAVSLWMISDERLPRKALFFVVFGFLIKVFVNSMYLYLLVNDRYSTGSYYDPLWSLSLFFIGIAGLYAKAPSKPSSSQWLGHSRFNVRHYLPYFCVMGLLVFVVLNRYQSINVMFGGFLLALSIMLIRQIFTMFKNEELLQKHKRLTEESLRKNLQLELMNQSLSEKEKQLTDVFDNLNAVIWSWDFRTNEMIISTGVEKFSEFSREELLADPSLWKTAIHPEDITVENDIHHIMSANRIGKPLIEYRLIQPDETIKWVQVLRTPIYDERGQLVKLHDVMTDITDRKNTEEKIHSLAYYDKLTGLPNRNLFYSSLKQEIERVNQFNNKLAVLFIDLDRFKWVNDTLGHQMGDQLLRDVAMRLKVCIGKCGTVCRMGGDEFTVILPSKSIKDSQTISEKIIEALAAPFFIADHEIYVTPSIGISLYPDHGEKRQDLIKKADMAMYQAKESGKNTYQVYTSELERKNARKMNLEKALQRAIENEEFSLHYQPQVELESGRIVGLEALVRWTHPELGPVSPAEFIPLGEETGKIVPIGEWVLTLACRQYKLWEKAGLPAVPISVNVSAKQLTLDFVSTVSRVLEEYDMTPCTLELEITESVMQNVEESAIILNELKSLGVQISLDDFGTGYSSLNYLAHLPIDKIKIDKSFIDDISDYSNGGVMVKTIIDMGKNLNFAIVAEGIENLNQTQFLLQNGCYFGQGYFFSPPLPADQMSNLLEGLAPVRMVVER